MISLRAAACDAPVRICCQICNCNWCKCAAVADAVSCDESSFLWELTQNRKENMFGLLHGSSSCWDAVVELTCWWTIHCIQHSCAAVRHCVLWPRGTWFSTMMSTRNYTNVETSKHSTPCPVVSPAVFLYQSTIQRNQLEKSSKPEN